VVQIVVQMGRYFDEANLRRWRFGAYGPPYGRVSKPEHTARPVLPKAPGVWKYATLQNLTLDEL